MAQNEFRCPDDDGWFKLIVPTERGDVEILLDLWRCNNQIVDIQNEYKDKKVEEGMDALIAVIRGWSPGFPEISQKMAATIAASVCGRCAEQEKKSSPAQPNSSLPSCAGTTETQASGTPTQAS